MKKIKLKINDKIRSVILLAVIGFATTFCYVQYESFKQLKEQLKNIHVTQDVFHVKLQRLDNIYTSLQQGVDRIRDNHLQDIVRLEDKFQYMEKSKQLETKEINSSHNDKSKENKNTNLELYGILKLVEMQALELNSPAAARDTLHVINKYIDKINGVDLVRPVIECDLAAVERLIDNEKATLDKIDVVLQFVHDLTKIDSSASLDPLNKSAEKKWWQNIFQGVKITKIEQKASAKTTNLMLDAAVKLKSSFQQKDLATYALLLHQIEIGLDARSKDTKSLTKIKELLQELANIDFYVRDGFCTEKLLHIAVDSAEVQKPIVKSDDTSLEKKNLNEEVD